MKSNESIGIVGMTCVSCAKTIENSIKKVEGVSKADVNFAAEKVNIDYDPSLSKKEDLEKAIEDAGYTAIKEEKNGNVLKLKVVGMDKLVRIKFVF